jgi:hypothetical protein
MVAYNRKVRIHAIYSYSSEPVLDQHSRFLLVVDAFLYSKLWFLLAAPSQTSRSSWPQLWLSQGGWGGGGGGVDETNPTRIKKKKKK